MNSKGSGRVLLLGLVALMAALLAGPQRAGAQSRRGDGRSGHSNRRPSSDRYNFWRDRMAEEIRRRMAERGEGPGNEPPQQDRPERGQVLARFVKWTEGKDGRASALIMVVSDEEGKNTASLIVPRTATSKSGEIIPTGTIAAAARKLKIGDEVSVDYTNFKGRTTADAVELKRSLSDGDKDPFTFVRAETVTWGGRKLLGVTAKRDKLDWTFLIPNEQVSAASFTGPDGKPLGEGTVSVPAPRMLTCLADIRSGDLISIEYAPDDCRFVLSNLEVSKLSAKGKFERLSARLVDGKRHEMAMVRVGTRTLSLVLPLPEAKDGPVSQAARMSALLKDMRQWQAVTVQYRRQNGTTWLDSITVTP